MCVPFPLTLVGRRPSSGEGIFLAAIGRFPWCKSDVNGLRLREIGRERRVPYLENFAMLDAKTEISDAEAKVMRIFRLYGVAPYQMLCLNSRLVEDLHAPLDRLIRKGLIVREGHHDPYHLTPTGHQAVSRIRSLEDGSNE